MIRRTILLLGLGVALAGGIGTAVHAASQTTSRPAIHSPVTSGQDVPDAIDTDAGAPCVTTGAAGEQTGSCTDSRQETGSRGSAGSADAPDGAETSGPDGDSVQSGP